MGHPLKSIAELNKLMGMPPLREYWRALNRLDRQEKAVTRAKRKASDQKRKKCRCEAYPWPHRPGGGFCRYPDPPLERWQRADWNHRPYRKRYAGIRRQIARANGLHPIRDRAAIDALMLRVIAQARQLKRQYPHLKYRNMEITEHGVTGHWQNAGPMM